MSVSVASNFGFRPKLLDALKGYSAADLRRDLFAGMNIGHHVALDPFLDLSRVGRARLGGGPT